MIRIFIVATVICLCTATLVSVPARGEAPDHPLDAHLGERYTGDLDAMLERKYIRVLTTYNRTNFFLHGGTPRGFEYALLRGYQEQLNKAINRHSLKIVLDFIPVARDRLLPDLVAGYGDIAAAGLTITPERRETVDFTRPYLTGIDEVLVQHEALGPVDNVADLSAKRIFVRSSSSYYQSLKKLNQQLISEGRRPVRIEAADENLETEDILELVNSGAVPRTVCDSHIAAAWAEILPGIRVFSDVTFRQGASIAWAVRKNNPALKQSLNHYLKSHRKGTRLGNIYFSRYYETTTWIKNPMEGLAGRRLSRLIPIFKKYAERYGFDWRLIAAMAYQESGFDQSKVSPQGAVGIMQIRPVTAADPVVGISDVSGADSNIHAGVKYLDFLRSHYFSDADIRPRDRVRFSLAAYNAGPRRIRRARKRARRMGLDPNRWFRNVEMAMLKIVGQETVRYVSNINKYYVIYKNSATQLKLRENAVERMEQ